jgi:hypothetical protein
VLLPLGFGLTAVVAAFGATMAPSLSSAVRAAAEGSLSQKHRPRSQTDGANRAPPSGYYAGAPGEIVKLCTIKLMLEHGRLDRSMRGMRV